MPPERTIVVVLTGPSSAGKTSLAREIQRQSQIPLAHIEADRMFPSMPPEVHRSIVDGLGLERRPCSSSSDRFSGVKSRP
ncbi:hypothetical protein ACFFWC_02875 [Plantactinospora siamensis]|uniref:UDP-N-acetylglucosamine kinase n=1 Tax=Plantactinospora siamensis TaxID=555372 RepID=A0ABV6NQB7_9ACTN